MEYINPEENMNADIKYSTSVSSVALDFSQKTAVFFLK